MKKALVILLALSMVGAAFAEDVVAPEASGSVSATYGYDLDANIGGFQNSADAKITFPLVASGTKATEGEGLWGEIKITDFLLKVDTADGLDYKGDDFGISGKIHLGDAYVGIYGAPGLGVNYAENYNTDNGNTVVDVNTSNDWIGADAGISLGYATDMFSVNFDIASMGDWTSGAGDTAVDGDHTPGTVTNDRDASDPDTNLNTDNLYVFQANVEVKPVDGFTLNADATFSNKKYADANNGAVTTVNVKAAYEMDALTFSLGFDLVSMAEKVPVIDMSMMYDLAPAVSYKVVEGFDVAAKGYYAATDAKEVTGFTPVVYSYAKFSVTEALDKGFVDGVGFGLSVVLRDLIDDTPIKVGALADGKKMEYYVDGDVSFKAAEGLTLKANVGYGIDETFSAGASVEAGAAFTGISNTTFTAAYSDFASTAGTTTKGVVTLKAAIAF